MAFIQDQQCIFGQVIKQGGRRLTLPALTSPLDIGTDYILGLTRDELDVEDESSLRRLEPGVFWVDGAMKIEELNEALDLDLKEGEYDTVAGLVLERLERIPRPGERVRENGVWIEVASAEPNRISAVRLILVDGDRETGAGQREER